LTKALAKLEVDPMFTTTVIALATFATLALGASPSETAAAEGSLARNVLRKTVSGKTVYLRFSGFELPIRYSTGSMSMVAAALARGDGAADRGKWWAQAISSASAGRAGWMASPIATSSPLEARRQLAAQ
jgi:hypothetical protein